MSLTLKPQSAPHPDLVPMDIYIDGQHCGEARPRTDVLPPRPADDPYLWHAQVHLDRWRSGLGIRSGVMHLLQGFGPTPEEAIRDAVSNAMRDASALADATTLLSASLEA